MSRTLYVKINEHGNRIGEDHPRAKFTDSDIDLVFELAEQGMTSRQISAKLEMSLDTVKKIRCGQRRGQVCAGHKAVHIR